MDNFETITVSVDHEGRLTIPKKYRECMDINTGAKLDILVKGEYLILRKTAYRENDDLLNYTKSIIKNVNFDYKE